jgi:sugar lactone lactonase YvrE
MRGFFNPVLLATLFALPFSAQAGTLNNPQGLAFDSQGHLWIANQNDNNVIEATATGTGSVISTVTDGINGPSRLAFDSLGNLYVANTNGNTVTEYNSAGTLIRTISGSFIDQPLGLAVDAFGDVYIANNGLNNVIAVNISGNVIETLTEDNSGIEFNAPGAIGINGEDIYIGLGGSGLDGVIRYNGGEFLTGNPAEQVIYTNSVNTGPTGIAFDNSGNVYVSDLYSGTWVQYNSAGVLQRSVNSGYSTGIAWDNKNHYVYVTNAVENEINYYTRTGTLKGTLF